VRVRRTSVAGTWYPDIPARLISEIDSYLDRARVADVSGRLRAIIAPHAGLMYSGPVAAHAYSVARRHRPSALVLVGPSHFIPFDGVSIWPDGEWQTPFGSVTVEGDLAAAIMTASQAGPPEGGPHVNIVDLPGAHGREHSLEMQMPFIAHLLPGVPIVPMVMGRQTRETSFALGEAIAECLAAHAPDALIVASSDLSHYEDAMTAASLDGVVMRHVESLDAAALMRALEDEPRHACGGGPMVAVMAAATALGATESRLLQYADSGDVSGDKSSVVGYMAAAIW
jgi:AmmeMemoRadiSam system protein B